MNLYADGACKTSDNTGGWAFVLENDDKQIHSDFNSEDDTTNNRMEIMAVIKGLEYCKENSILDVSVVIDSMYVIGTMSKNWKRNKNKDLWEILDDVVKGMNLEWVHVKGHTGHEWNEKCDALAVTASNYNK